MLDLKTVLIVTLATASLQAIVWICVWRAWRRLYELKFLAAGFTAIALGVLMMILRGEQPAAWSVVLHNTVIKLGLVLLAEGLARFLGQPRYTWIGISLLVFQVATWSIALAVSPSDLAIRVHASTFFTVVMMSVMCLALGRDRTQPWYLRWITIGLLIEYMAASVVQSGLEFWAPATVQGITILDNRNAWYLLQGTLFLIALFACLLFMVSWRLSADLREKNMALSREVLERQRLAGRLHASLEAERTLREEQADLMRLVSHEFRVPLAVIRNAADMIELTGGKAGRATRERLAGIGQALDRLFSLVDRFLTSDRDNGFQPESIPIARLLANVQLHFEMAGLGPRLHFNKDGNASSVYADPDMLATVVINLVDNALKYSPEDQPIHIDIRTNEGHLIIQVRDRGIGIPIAEQHKIGRRFFRASNTQAGTGSGLGLYSSRKFLAYHDGLLELLPNAGPGTMAVVRVPLAGKAARQAEPTEPSTWHMY
ncbi:MAG TPA: HAMP domain-containing sensor histidine kinase [Bordetella sp.]|nr:HAMP domain-containing sensor histidine kinase [Bordetella sp.]